MADSIRNGRKAAFSAFSFFVLALGAILVTGCEVQVDRGSPKSNATDLNGTGQADDLAERISSRIAEKISSDPAFIDAVSDAVARKTGSQSSQAALLSGEASAGGKKNDDSNSSSPHDGDINRPESVIGLSRNGRGRKFGNVVPSSTPLAVLGDEIVTKGDMVEFANRQSQVELAKMKSSYSALEESLNNYLDQRLLLSEARAMGCESDPRYLRRIEDYKRGYAIDTFMNARLRELSDVSVADARAYYDANIGLYKKALQVEAFMILVDDPDLALKLIDRIRQGENFNELAFEYSIDRSRTAGGYLGFIEKGKWPNAFEDLVFSLDFNEVGGPVQTDFGHHLVLRKKTRPAMDIPFEAASDSIIALLRKERKPIFVERLTGELRKITGVTVEEEVVLQAFGNGLDGVPAETMGKTIFTIGEKPFTVADLVKYVRSFPSGAVEAAVSEPGGLVSLVKRIMNEELLYVEAVKRGYQVPAQSLAAFVDSLKSLAVSILLDSRVRDRLVITPDAPRLYYEQKREEFTVPPRFRLKAIVALDLTAADAIKARLKAGESFDTLARTANTDSVLAAKSGELGWIGAEALPAHVIKVLETMKAGDISEPLVFNGQLYILMTEEVRESRIPPFEEVAGQAEAKVKGFAYDKLKENYVSEVRSKRPAKVDELVLKDIHDQLNQRGAYSSEAMREQAVDASDGSMAADASKLARTALPPDGRVSSDGSVIAEVDGAAFTVGDLKSEYSRLKPVIRERYRDYDGALRVMGVYLERHAMVKEALRRGIDGRKAFKDLMEGTSKALAMEILIREKALTGIFVGPGEVSEYYEKNKGQFEFAQARIVLNSDRATVEKAFEAVRTGTFFHDAAKAFSTDSSASKGGVIPPVRRNELPRPENFYSKLFEVKEGSFVEPEETPAGWAFMMLEKRWTLPLQRVSEEIRLNLTANQSKERARKFVEGTRAETFLEIDREGIEKGPGEWGTSLAEKKLMGFSGKSYTGTDLAAGLFTISPAMRRAVESEAGARDDFIDKFINTEILFAEAEKAGVTDSAEYLDRLAYSREARLAEVLREEVRKSISSDEEILKGYWEKNKGWFTRPETARISYIHFKCGKDEGERKSAMARAMTVFERIRGKEEFAKVADEVSDSRDGNGGDLGYFAKGDLVAGYELAAFEVPVGEVSEPFFTDTGLHIVKVTERSQAISPAFEECRNEVLTKYVQEEGARQAELLPIKLRRELKIVLHREVLEKIDFGSF